MGKHVPHIRAPIRGGGSGPNPIVWSLGFTRLYHSNSILVGSSVSHAVLTVHTRTDRARPRLQQCAASNAMYAMQPNYIAFDSSDDICTCSSDFQVTTETPIIKEKCKLNFSIIVSQHSSENFRKIGQICIQVTANNVRILCIRDTVHTLTRFWRSNAV